MPSECFTQKISGPYHCLYFFSVLKLQSPRVKKRLLDTVVTLGETRKPWDEVDRQAHSEQTSPSCAGRMRDVESSSFGFRGALPSHHRARPSGDLRRAPTAVRVNARLRTELALT